MYKGNVCSRKSVLVNTNTNFNSNIENEQEAKTKNLEGSFGFNRYWNENRNSVLFKNEFRLDTSKLINI